MPFGFIRFLGVYFSFVVFGLLCFSCLFFFFEEGWLCCVSCVCCLCLSSFLQNNKQQQKKKKKEIIITTITKKKKKMEPINEEVFLPAERQNKRRMKILLSRKRDGRETKAWKESFLECCVGGDMQVRKREKRERSGGGGERGRVFFEGSVSWNGKNKKKKKKKKKKKFS